MLALVPAQDLRLLKADCAAESLVDQESINCWVEKRRCELAHRSILAGSTVLCHIHCLIEMSKYYDFNINIIFELKNLAKLNFRTTNYVKIEYQNMIPIKPFTK